MQLATGRRYHPLVEELYVQRLLNASVLVRTDKPRLVSGLERPTLFVHLEHFIQDEARLELFRRLDVRIIDGLDLALQF